MAQRDIRPLGAGDGTAFYWIKMSNHPGSGQLTLVAIDEFGEVTTTPIRGQWDEAAMTKAEAVEFHLAGAVAEADRALERRRRDRPELEPTPPPMDPATRRFFES
jgi:hypothetical protein